MSRSVEMFPSASWLIFLRLEDPEEIDREDPWYWDDVRDNLFDVIKDYCPTVQPSDRWLGRETRALAENEHGIFTLAEYGGVMALGFVPDLNLDDFGLALAERYAGEAHDRLYNCTEFAADLLDLHGFMSNGEAVFQTVLSIRNGSLSAVAS